jgi:hypothetical protein
MSQIGPVEGGFNDHVRLFARHKRDRKPRREWLPDLSAGNTRRGIGNGDPRFAEAGDLNQPQRAADDGWTSALPSPVGNSVAGE